MNSFHNQNVVYSVKNWYIATTTYLNWLQFPNSKKNSFQDKILFNSYFFLIFGRSARSLFLGRWHFWGRCGSHISSGYSWGSLHNFTWTILFLQCRFDLEKQKMKFKFKFQILNAKKLLQSKTKTILRSYAANFLQICANLQKSWNNMMSNVGLIIENVDLSHIFI